MRHREAWPVKVFRTILSCGIRLLMRCVYRIRVRGMDRLEPGGALLIANHLSHVDALMIGAAMHRDIVFLMHRSFFSVPLVGTVARLYGTIPIASEDNAEEKRQSLARAVEHAKNGRLVCIFPEGAISRSGQLLGFRRGMETIARDAGVRIQPIVLDRVWGSIFSYERGRFFFKRPRRWPYPLDLVIGESLPPDTPAWRAHEELAALQALARHLHYAEAMPLAERLRRMKAPVELSGPFLRGELRFGERCFAPNALLAAAQSLQAVHALRVRQHIWIGCSLERCPAVLLAALLSGARVSTGSIPAPDADAWYFEADMLERLRAQPQKPVLCVCIAEQRATGWPGLLWVRLGPQWGGVLTTEVPAAGKEQGARAEGFGRALPGTALSIRDEHGQALEPGCAGTVHVWSAFASTARAGEPLSWENSGIRGWMDRDGFLLEA